LTLASTIVGALIGVGSTLLADRLRWSRDRSKGTFEARRQLYSDFLADLSLTRDAVRAAGRGYHDADVSRQQAANDAFRSANLYSRRYQVSISAPPGVVGAATATFRSLRRLRDVVAAGHDNESEEYVAERERYEASLTALIKRMRDDLGPVTGQQPE
jgi:hypothetical protein